MKPLNVIVPCHKGDQDQAIRLLSWIGEMGMVQAPFTLLCDNQCNVQLLLDLARKAFSKVDWLEDRERIECNWGQLGDHAKSAAGPNSLFRQAAWYFYTKKSGPWFWCEPDAIWCRRDTYQMIEREYQLGNKAFMGYKVTPQNHPGVPNHMSGVAVYHEETAMRCPLASNAGEVAFDIAGVEETCRDDRTHFTPILFHRYRAPGFTSEQDFNDRVPEYLAVYHANKDGSIYTFLRKRLGMAPVREVQLAEPLPSKQIVAGSIPVTHSNLITDDEFRAVGLGGPTVDIFIKTWERDYPWVEWCYKSIEKFSSGFRRVVTVDDNCKEGSGKKHVVISEPPKTPGYLWQQVCKLHADQKTDADFILFMDSDCVFTRNVTPNDFIKDGKPIWQYTPLDQARPDQHVWAPVMEKFLGKKPEHEFMRRHPFIVPRWAFEELRTFCKYRHGKSLEDYIMGEADPNNGLSLRFSEWNCLGFFLWEYHRDRIEWVLDSAAGPGCIYQGFTHGGDGRRDEDLAKFREILGEDGIRVEGEPPTSCAIPAVSTPVLTEASAIEFLASQVKNNFHKARIIKNLKAAWKGRGSSSESLLVKAAEIAKDLGDKELNGKRLAMKGSTGFLLCIHSYPGANETMVRHWPNFKKAGATRIAGIGTTDGKCTWPDGLDTVVDIGENSYMKLKGKDDHLCRRLLDTVKWCLTQPEDHFAIVEYDTLILRKFPHFSGVHAHLTGGQVNGSKTKHFYHNPWLFDRQAGAALVQAMEGVLPDSQEYPNNSPDLFFGLAVERAQIEVKCCFKLFTRNSLDQNGDLELACEQAVDGVHAIHGVKTEEEYNSIMRALNEQHLALSHVA